MRIIDNLYNWGIILGIVLLCGQVQAQDGGGMDNVNYNPSTELNSRLKLPKSPEADAFEKYGNTTVNLYTGQPDINVPLHVFKGREFEVSMGLNYDASGVKVNQIATNAGLGWNLNFGGRISRIAVGKPDDIGMGPLTDNLLILNNISNTFNSEAQLSSYIEDFMKPAISGQLDTELDLFSLNAIGINDYIVFDLESSEPHTLLNPRTQVNFLSDNSGWIITTEDGTEYYFGGGNIRETTKIEGGDDSQGNAGGTYSGISTTSWLLTKIVSKNKLDVFEFNYKLYTWGNNNFSTTVSSKTYKYKLTCPIGWYNSGLDAFDRNRPFKISQQMPLSVKLNGEYLAKITYKSREDLLFENNPYQGGNALNEICFYKYKAAVTDINFETNDNSNYFKKVVFNHSYFGTVPSGGQNQIYKRLKLDNLTIYQSSLAEGKKYAFRYKFPEQIPAINSKAQDFWGLFNGAYNNPDLIPSSDLGSHLVPGADRSFNFSKAVIGTLDRITYPTKGYTDFTFEQNELSNNQNIPDYHYIDDVPVFNLGPVCAAWYDDLPAVYQNRHPNMNSIYYPYFGLPNSQSNNYYLNSIRTVLMTIDEDFDYKIQAGGSGVYLIQKITGCSNPEILNFPNVYDACADGDELLDIYTCLRPTNSLYITRNTNGSYTSHPSDYVKGDFTWNTEEKQTLHLDAGQYQVTIWAGPDQMNEISSYPWVKIFKPTPKVIPAHTNYGTKTAEGFRIKSIKNYTQESKIATEKQYQYSLDFNAANSSGVRIANIPNAVTIYNTYSVFCTGNANHGMLGSIPTAVLRSPNISASPYLAYSSVLETEIDSIGEINGYTQHKFNVGETGVISSDTGSTSFDAVFENGKISEKNIFDKNKNPQSAEKYTYGSKQFYECVAGSFRKSQDNKYAFISQYGSGMQYAWGHVDSGDIDMPGPAGAPEWPSSYVWTDNTLGQYSYYLTSQNIVGRYGYLSKKETSTFTVGGQEIKQVEDYDYEAFSPFMLQSKTTGTSLEDSRIETYTYHDDYPENPEKITDIKNYRGSTLLFHRNNVYTNYGTTANFVTEIKTAKATNALEPRMKFDYDADSKNIITSLQDMTSTSHLSYDSYIYGYNDMFPVAKLSGVKYSDIPGNLITDIKLKSSQPINDTNDNALRTSLNALRTSFPNALITTFTYDPRIGVSSKTDEKGNITSYEYDELGRLKIVRDNDGNILSENQYHYKN